MKSQALHYVFNSPVDKFVYVSYQSYPHKILTGRKYDFIDDNRFAEVSGYTNQDESEHDFFKVGHTLTSVSLAVGLAKARDLKGDKENIIAIIGDGSLSGGMAYAENDKENWHYGAPFNAQDGSRPVEEEEEDYGDITATFLLEKMKKDSRVVAITSGTPTSIGFTEDRRKSQEIF